MGLGRKMARKTARKAVRRTVRTVTPRPVRQVAHPMRTARIAATPRPVRQVTRAAWAVQHPVRAAESEIVAAARARRRRWTLLGLFGLSSGANRRQQAQSADRPTTAPAPGPL